MSRSKLLSCTFLLFFIFAAATLITSDLSAETSLHATTWQWSSLVETEPAAQSVVPQPENYTLTFAEDGALKIKADCNMAQGTYSVEDKKLSIVLGPTTMAACDDQSLDIMYLGLLGRVGSYAFNDDKLILNLQEGKGQMTFNKL